MPQITVTDEATRLTSVDTRGSGQAALVRNRGAVSVFLGPNDAVTTANGFELAPDDGAVGLDIDPGEAYYAIAAAGQSARVDVLEQGV